MEGSLEPRKNLRWFLKKNETKIVGDRFIKTN